MIKNLIVNGCSFTNGPYITWADVVNEHIKPDCFVNLGAPAAGNYYILNSTVDYIKHHDVNPSESLILIMWSGLYRKDLLIDDETFNAIENDYEYLAKDQTRKYLFSGGSAHSWLQNSFTKRIFEPIYRVSDQKTLAFESLQSITLLESYLKNNNYNYYFMSYFNYWNDQFAGETNLSTILPDYKIDLSKWIVTEDKSCIGDWCLKNNLLDSGFHPTPMGHQRFAREIIIPTL